MSQTTEPKRQSKECKACISEQETSFDFLDNSSSEVNDDIIDTDFYSVSETLEASDHDYQDKRKEDPSSQNSNQIVFENQSKKTRVNEQEKLKELSSRDRSREIQIYCAICCPCICVFLLLLELIRCIVNCNPRNDYFED